MLDRSAAISGLTEFQLSYHSGMSRQGVPVRDTHGMPLLFTACPQLPEPVRTD
jgi:hypothetical protein